MMTREQRLKEREVKRILHEEELAKLEEDSKKIEAGDSRISERHLKAQMEQRQRELERLAQEDDWVFDCAVCGIHGENLVRPHTQLGNAQTDGKQDDGSHSIACEKCNVWQHSKCHGIAVEEAERDDFHFVCADCSRRDEEAKRPKTPSLKIRLSSSPQSEKKRKAAEMTGDVANSTDSERPITSRKLESVQISPPQKPQSYSNHVGSPTSVRSGPSLSPNGQGAAPPGMFRPNGIPNLYQPTWNGQPPDFPARPSSSSRAMGLAISNGVATGSPTPNRMTNGFTNGDNPCAVPNTPTNHIGNGVSSSTYLSGIASSGNDPFHTSFGQQRPPSAHSMPQAASPIKQQSSYSPHQSIYLPNSSPFTAPTNPSTSFPPATQQSAQFGHSPVKQNSLSPQPAYSPPQRFQQQSTGNIFPPSVPPPAKHELPRPVSSHSVMSSQGFPPAPALSPSAHPQILDPPTKKSPEQQSQGANYGERL